MIKKFNSFSEDLIIESAINESILYYSPDFKFRINQLKGNRIADELIRLEGNDIEDFDITFINLSKEVGYLNFQTMRKAKEKAESVWVNSKIKFDKEWEPSVNNSLYNNDISGYNRTGIYWNNNNQIRIGKFIKKLSKGKFGDAEIEDFVNNLKSAQDEPEKIEIVSGDDIEYWYDFKNYYPSNNGTLMNSCMAERKFFNLYTKNPEVCRLLIMTDNDKLVSRALVWRINSIQGDDLKEKPEYFMDRIYYIKDHHRNSMEKYAADKGWACRSIDDIISYKGESHMVKMSVKIKKETGEFTYDPFPYLDTFKRYDFKTGLLWNDRQRGKNVRGHLLTDTQGGYTSTQG